MVSIRLPVIEAERIRLFSLRRYSLANTQSCSYVNQKIVWGGEGKNEKR